MRSVWCVLCVVVGCGEHVFVGMVPAVLRWIIVLAVLVLGGVISMRRSQQSVYADGASLSAPSWFKSSVILSTGHS